MKIQSLISLNPSLSILISAFSQAQCRLVYYPPNAVCIEYMIPVNLTAAVSNFNGTKWTDNAGLTDFVTDFVGRVPGFPSPLSTPQNVTSHFTIGSTFCTPKIANTSHADTVILASHGFGFDRSYWSLAYEPEKYNFVDFAISQGYSVFFYDRLGVGSSSRISGFTNQFSIQPSILIELAGLLKAGKYTGNIGVPRAVTLIGHSFGSILTHGVAVYAPQAVDEIVLTGYGLNFSTIDLPLVLQGWNVRIAETASAEVDAGYLTWVDLYANINMLVSINCAQGTKETYNAIRFFKALGYDISAAQFLEANKQPFAVGELLTAEPSLSKFPVPKFSGPVLLINGAYCVDVLQHPAAELFSSSMNFESHVQPGMSHAMNLHYNATGYYRVVTDFLSDNGF
ncbi:hypothetical protein MMC28_001769 [Mycoblastus sanguinarius]|nr:hypothetical protein [Mycoblastus sanguinarius]